MKQAGKHVGTRPTGYPHQHLSNRCAGQNVAGCEPRWEELACQTNHCRPLGQVYLQAAKQQIPLSARVGRPHDEDGRSGPCPYRPSYAHPAGRW